MRRRTAIALRVAVVAVATTGLTVLAGTTGSAAGQTTAPVGQSGRYLLDGTGRVVVLHGLNQVYKVAPYEPSADGFSDDDAAFLAANGFDAMRIGVIWAAVEPEPGVYDDGYLTSIAQTVQTLANHGIVSLLDFHQDLYNEEFQGEGAPAWAVQDGGLFNPKLGFPFNYFANLAEEHAWDAFWTDQKAPDGVGLQEHYAAAWAHVAAKFHNNPAVLGYEVMNEPWPGTLWEQCGAPVVGCPLFDSALTKFYKKVDTAIRHVDTHTEIWVEPNTLFSTVDSTDVGPISDSHLGFAFHDYCATESEGLGNTACPALDKLTVSSAGAYANKRGLPWLMTEFGATTDATYLKQMTSLADTNKLSWLEWAYTGNDITSSSPNGQALVLNPALPPVGANVVTSTLDVLAEPYPQLIAGTPNSWSFSGGVFKLSYSTAKVRGGRFVTGSVTDVAAPSVQFPNGYTVAVSGATVASAPNAPTLVLKQKAGAVTVTVTVSPVA